MTCRCGKPLPPRALKWCSDNCRKRTWDADHSGQCSRCGARIEASVVRKSRRTGDEARCWGCEVAIRRAGHEAKLDDIQVMWEAGLPIKQIAAELGYGPNSWPPEIAELRRRGRIGYRYHGCEGRAA